MEITSEELQIALLVWQLSFRLETQEESYRFALSWLSPVVCSYLYSSASSQSYIYPRRTGPRYFTGHGVVIGFLSMTFVLAAFMLVYLGRQNKKRDEVDAARGKYTEEEYVQCTSYLCIYIAISLLNGSFRQIKTRARTRPSKHSVTSSRDSDSFPRCFSFRYTL